MSARNWKQSKTYCRQCKSWKTDISHVDCPKGQSGSKVWIDIANFEKRCNKCNQTWRLEDNVFHCSCGNVQTTRYTDSVLALEYGDQVISTDGNFVYVLKRSGVVAVGRRRYDDISYNTPSSQTNHKRSGKGIIAGTIEELTAKRALFMAALVIIYFFFFSAHWNPLIETSIGKYLPSSLNLTEIIILLALLLASKRIRSLFIGLFVIINVIKIGFYLFLTHATAHPYVHVPFSIWPW